MTVTSDNTSICTVAEIREAALPADDRATGGAHGDRYFMLVGKTILREAMRGRLPESIRTRPKTAAPGDLVRNMVTNGKLTPHALGDAAGLPNPVMPEKFMAAWERYCNGEGADSTWTSWLILQPIAYGNWLLEQQEFAK